MFCGQICVLRRDVGMSHLKAVYVYAYVHSVVLT